MWQQFTDEARSAIMLAQEAARQMQSPEIDTSHFLLALLHQPGSLVTQLLNRQGLTYNVAVEKLQHTFQTNPGETKNEPRLTKNSKIVLEMAAEKAYRPNNRPIGIEHLLLALVEVDRNPAFPVLREYGVGADLIYPLLFVRHRIKHQGPEHKEKAGD